MFETLSLGGLSWTELAKRVWAEMQDDEVLGRSAQLSYYFLLALFPLLLFLTTVIGLIIGSGTGMRRALFDYIGQVLPGSASQLVSDTMREVSTNSGGGKLSFGILAALWAASNGMGAISESLNVAYDVKEERPWWKTRLTAVILTLALAILIISALVLVLFGHDIGETVAAKFGLGTAFELGWKILQWPVVLLFVLIGFALIYYLAPDLKQHDWKWVTPGSIIGVVLWLLVSFGFKTYLEFFDSYSTTYGSLGAVIILMLWFYFTGAAILIGGEINSEIEHAMAERGDPDAKDRGEKVPGEKDGEAPGKAVDDGKSAGAAGTGKKSAALAQSSGGKKSLPQAKTTHARATRPRRKSGEERSFSIGKLFVVLGAWGLSKFKRGAK